MKRPAGILESWAVVFSLVLSSAPAHATKLKLVNLETMVHEASRIFSGTCVGVEDASLPESDVSVTRYTFKVDEPIKGDVGDTVVVTQLGARRPRVEGERTKVFRVPGMPVYHVGQQVALFLVAESRLGLSSPVGLSQGAFTVDEAGGRRVLRNGLRNAGLWKGISAEASSSRWKLADEEKSLLSVESGPMDYELFIRVVRKILQSSGMPE